MSDGINGSLSDRAEARREAAEREQAHAKGLHAPGCHPAWGMCECGLAEHLSAENADLRARLDQSEAERDAMKADLERVQAEAAAMRGALTEAQSRLRRPIKLIRDDGFNAAMEAITAALSGQAGADLLAEVTRLREIERLVKKYAAISSNRRWLLGVGQDFRNHHSVCAKAFREREYLHQTEIAARNALFTAVGKEAVE